MCTQIEMDQEAEDIVWRVMFEYPSQNNPGGSPGVIMKNNFMAFQNSMWAHWLISGCSFWTNRVDWWTDQLANNTYSTYQTALKLAKIEFAQSMHTLCNCPGPVPQ